MEQANDVEYEYNSSDDDFGPPPVNPFANAGRASIASIIQNAAQDRATSKAFTKNLIFTKGRPGTQYRNQLWLQRFNTFREHTLNVQADQTPTGQQIERFLKVVTQNVKPTSNEVPSYQWLNGGFRHLLLSLVFYHPKFNLTKHDTARISTAFDVLLKDGKLTTKASQSHNWVGVYLLRRIVVAIYEDALLAGTLSWDVTLSKILSIVLTSALSCRAGDIAKDPLDDQPLPYLTYGDIDLKLCSGGNSLDDMMTRIVIRNEKSKKNNQQKNRTAVVNCLRNNNDNVLCVVKLILVIALRSGNIDSAETITEVIERAKSRKDRKVQWRNPDLPVLCAIVGHGSSLLLEKPAHRTQISRNLSDAGILAGVLTPLTGHDLRRGVARDVANMSKGIKGLASRAIAETLGHSKPALDRGITSRYVGPSTTDVWTARIDENYNDPFGPEVTDNPCLKKRKLARNALQDLCANQQIDINRQERYDDTQVKLAQNNTVRASSGVSSDVESGNDMDRENLENMLSNSDNAILTESIEEVVLDQLSVGIPNATLCCTSIKFVEYFARINVTRNQNLARPSDESAQRISELSTNGRDTVTFLKQPCKNRDFGCTYEHYYNTLLVDHEKRCKWSADKIDTPTHKFACDRLGCSSSFKTMWRLNEHIRQCHEWKRRGCAKGECDPSILFGTIHQYDDHVKRMHSGFVPTKCSVPGCKSMTVFSLSKIYLRHLTEVHGILGKDRDKYR